MANGYDGLYAEVKYTFHFLDYCEALVAAEERFFSHLGNLRATSALRPRMLAVLNETEATLKCVEERLYQDIRRRIVEHNDSMAEAYTVGLANAMKNAGHPDAEVDERVKGTIERTRIDHRSIETQFGSISVSVSNLREKVGKFTDEV
jgi:hypothetical protein